MNAFLFRKTTLCLLLGAGLSMPVTACSGSKNAPGSNTSIRTNTVDLDNMEEDILFYVNKFRKSHGLAPLQLNETICIEARQHSRDMATGRSKFGHSGFDDRADHLKEKLGKIQGVAENVAYGYLSAKAVVDGWIKSPGHRKNLLGNYNLIGIGVAKGDKNTLFYTQVFIRK